MVFLRREGKAMVRRNEFRAPKTPVSVNQRVSAVLNKLSFGPENLGKEQWLE